jgi:benzoyl-CoA reductase/2-hydroxyglutaryl-CoA dehydratase subunit BcrC/BadD/HgdB
VQSILECALQGDYDFLDGMIIGASTDTTKRLYDAWIRYINTQFCHLFDIPKFINEGALLHYMESIYSLIEEIKKHFNIKINNSDIADAISTCNETRRLLAELNDLRKTNSPPITSQQFLEICKLAMTGNKKDFNDSLETLLRQITPEKEKRQGFRILLTGSFQDQRWLLDIIEEKGGMVVCEDLCTRLRYFSGIVEEDTNLIRAIAKRYLKTKPASANLVSLDLRADYLLKLINGFNIDGVIYYILKFDDPYLFEFPDIKDILASNNIPVLRIETEHNTNAIGQIMTRVQAFMETLKLTKPRRACTLLME